jgi:hypothetical protein
LFQEDAKTPSKREAKTKLKEMKAKRRWSNIELAELQQQQETLDASRKTFEYYNLFYNNTVNMN